MGTITLSVPDELKSEMDAVDTINWSSVARHAFVEALQDVKELEAIKKAREVSGIAEDDSREIKGSVVKEVVESCEEASKELKSGTRKPMAVADLDKLMGLK